MSDEPRNGEDSNRTVTFYVGLPRTEVAFHFRISLTQKYYLRLHYSSIHITT